MNVRSSLMPFCDNCGQELRSDDIFCPSCGKENLNRGPAKQVGNSSNTQSQYQSPPPQYQPTQQYPPPYQPNYPRPGYPSSKYNQYAQRAVNAPFDYQLAPCGDRIVAYLIDSVITTIGTCFCYIPGIFYSLFKDGMRNGQSFGKGSANLRVVNFNTGLPATATESCIRNCCNCCVCWLLIEENRRHIGDLIAGTIVIKDE